MEILLGWSLVGFDMVLYKKCFVLVWYWDWVPWGGAGCRATGVEGAAEAD